MCKDCPSSLLKSCYYCGKSNSHNRCICAQKFKDSDVSLVVPESGQQSGRENVAHESVRPSNNNSTVQEHVRSPNSDNSASTTASTNPTNVPSLLASGERVLLQTATVVVQNPGGVATITARVLLDSASQRTFMTKNLAKQLNLKSEHQELLSFYICSKQIY